ncbi:MAG: hypothetical protein M3N07_08865 [Pseudomonadota bacterium]|nr:hypothetical protein [Pseudomonadota bacterium]
MPHAPLLAIVLTALAAALAAAPAAAGESRGGLAVGARVEPACRVSPEAVRCSTGTNWSATSTAGPPDRPLVQAARILGHPIRRSGRVLLTASPGVERSTAYLTVTY